MAKDRNTSKNIEDVEELAGWVTTKKAAEIIGLQWPTMSQMVYDRKIKAVRLGGLILVEKASALKYRAEREQSEKTRDREKLLKEKLAALTPEQLAKLLAQVEGETGV